MLHALPRRAASLIAVLSLAACSSSPAAPGADAAADVVTPDAAASDAPPAGDGGACADFSGAWSITGTCSVPGFSPFPSACITQTGCAAQIVVTTGPTPGTVVGNQLTFTSMVSGIALTCTATRSGEGTLQIRCEAGGLASCDAVAVRPTFPGATRWCCDVVAQDCGAGQRCNLVSTQPNDSTAISACVPAGTLTGGATCTREGGRLGADQCGAGLSCVNFGQAGTDDRTCQRLCRSSADCMGGVCLNVSSAPRAGICQTRCEILGTDCAAGTCRYRTTWPAESPDTAPAVLMPSCQPVGTTMEGATCTLTTDCAATLTCARRAATDPYTCRRVCDATHPCPMGTTCNGTMSDTNPSASGACLP